MPKEFGKFGLKNEQIKKDTLPLDENKSKRSIGDASKSGIESDTQTKFPLPVLLTCPHGGIVKSSPKRDSSIFLIVVILARIVTFLPFISLKASH